MSTILPTITTNDYIGVEPARIVLRPLLWLDEDQFFQLVSQNPELPLEQNSRGEVIVMSPTGGLAGWQNGRIFSQLSNWNDQHGRGMVFDSSTLFRLPNKAVRSPDATWIAKSRWNLLTLKQQKAIPPISPNFVVELRSETDRIVDLQDKLTEYLANGVELGWIVDPLMSQVHIYETGKPVQVLDRPATVAGTGCIDGFVLDLKEIFTPAC